MVSVLEILCHRSFHLILSAFSFNANVFSNIHVIFCSKTWCFLCWWLPARFRVSCLSSLDELIGVWVEAVQAQPNPKPPFFPFSWGNIVFLNASKENTFPPMCFSMEEEWAPTRHHPDLPLCFPFPFSPVRVLEQSFLWCMFNPALGLQKFEGSQFSAVATFASRL